MPTSLLPANRFAVISRITLAISRRLRGLRQTYKGRVTVGQPVYDASFSLALSGRHIAAPLPSTGFTEGPDISGHRLNLGRFLSLCLKLPLWQTRASVMSIFRDGRL